MAKRAVIGLILGLNFLGAAFAQSTLTIPEASRREVPNGRPIHESEEIILEGVVAAKSIHILDYSYLPLQDSSGHGIMLSGHLQRFDDMKPGDVLRARGTISIRAGVPVLQVADQVRIGKRPPPAPQAIRVRDANLPDMLGRAVVTEGRISNVPDTTGIGGEYLEVTDNQVSVRVFLPGRLREEHIGLHRFNVGDRVRITGVTSQNCPTAPYDRAYEILVSSPESVQLVEHIWLIPPQALMAAILSILGAALVWWMRERRMGRQRRLMRGLNTVAEEIVAANSLPTIKQKLKQFLPELTQASDVRLYVYEPSKNQLQPAQENPDSTGIISIDAPVGPVALLASLCFRNRSLLTIPDTRSTALLKQYDRSLLPKTMVFVPLLAQGELLGVLQLEHREGARTLNQEEQAALQHVANQIAISMRLQEQQTIREQLFRSEKLAAAGQLISGVASELRGPLQSISALTSHLLTTDDDTVLERELRTIKTEATRAAELVSRLVGFTKMGSSEQKKVNLHVVLSSLLDLRSREWHARGLRVRKLFDPSPAFVLAAQSQLEQVFLSLLVHAEQSMHPTGQRIITLSTSIVQQQVIVTVSYPIAPQSVTTDPFATGSNGEGLGLAVCRGIVQSQGGEMRSAVTSSQIRFDVELPLVEAPSDRKDPAVVRRSTRALTILLLEPDPEVQQQLLTLFSTYKHRVVPMKNATEAREVVQRLRFDLAFSAIRLADASWVEVFDQIRDKVGAFVLLTEAYDADLAQAVRAGDGFLLTKPVEEMDLERLLGQVEQRLEARAAVKSTSR